MDRKEFIELLEKYHKDELTQSEALALIYQCCLENGKEKDKCDALIKILSTQALINYMSQCLACSIHYFRAKFKTVELIKPHIMGHIILKIF